MTKNNFKLFLQEIAQQLQQAGIEDFENDATLLTAFVLKTTKSKFFLVQDISKKEKRKIRALAKKRTKRFPLQQIIGSVEFLGNTIEVNKNVLCPRFETELLADIVARHINADKGIKTVLDLCCGSGAIGIGIADKTSTVVTLADKSAKALKVAKKNVKRLGKNLKIIKSDLFSSIDNKFDLIVSNPPYIPTYELKTLMPEVALHEPKMALDGGVDGLEFYKRIIFGAQAHLNANGYIYFEFGLGQELEIEKLLKNSGFLEIEILKDYNNIKRFIKAKAGKQ